MRFLESLPASKTAPPFEIIRGRRPGTYFAVFQTTGAAYEFDRMYPWVFEGCPIVHFGQYENGFDLTEMYRSMQ